MTFKLVGAGLLMLAALAMCNPAHAAEQPLLSITRASLAVGVDYASYQNQGDQRLPNFVKEFEPGIFGAYVLTPHATLVGSGCYGLDNKIIRWKVGVRAVLWRGRD